MANPVHSPLGASGAERWMNCPGSVGLLKELNLDETDEPSYRLLGTHAHALAERCLKNGTDCWEEAGWLAELLEKPDDPDDGVHPTCMAVQVFVDECRTLISRGLGLAPGNSLTMWIEASFSSALHPLFYGTTDFACVIGTTLYVRDYKHGEGIPVDAVENPQIRYYGYGILQALEHIETVDYAIVQPRMYGEEKIKRWSESAASLRAWVDETLLPAMLRTELDNDLLPGDWCRFCPAKLVCPKLVGMFQAAAVADPAKVRELSDEQLDLEYPLIAPVKSYLKALEEQQFARLQAGKTFLNSKLVKKKADRVWKPGAEALFREQFGDEALVPAEFKSPAQAEKISERAKLMVHEWAYTPDSGLTVAPIGDKRAEVKVKTLAETFQAALENGGTG